MIEPDPGGPWDDAACALLITRIDGVVLRVNQAFVEWVGRPRDELVGAVRLSELLSVGGRIYWETHLAPLLHVEGRLDEVALDLKGPTGRLPVLLSAVVRGSDIGNGNDGAEPHAPSDTVHVSLASARERFRCERELVSSRRVADQAAATVQLLQTITAALSGAVGTSGVATAVLAAAVGPLRADAATLWLADLQGRLVAQGSLGESAPDTPADVLGSDRAAVAVDGRVVVPLRGTAALQGVLSLRRSDELSVISPDIATLTAVGQQTGLALDRARFYDQNANVAQELQHALLAVAAPEDPRFSVATTYRPGIELLEVGGDWYDVFLAADDVLALVVGDVVGRGLGAASAMGQLRSAVRAVASDLGPARLLARLDRFAASVAGAAMATVAYAELDLQTGHLKYAAGGHPPPLHLPSDGPPTFLWGGRSTPLGAFPGLAERTEAEIRLAPGDRLLMYTDGLFERRDRDLDEGLRIVAATAERSAALPLEEAVASLTRELLRDEQGRDDVCVLLFAWHGAERL